MLEQATTTLRPVTCALLGTDRPAQPQMYFHPVGSGQVLYLTLGHYRKHDMKPLADVVPVVRAHGKPPIRAIEAWYSGAHR